MERAVPALRLYRWLWEQHPTLVGATIALYYLRPLLEDKLLPSFLRVRAVSNSARHERIRLLARLAATPSSGEDGETTHPSVHRYARLALWASVLDAVVSKARQWVATTTRGRYKSFLVGLLLSTSPSSLHSLDRKMEGGLRRGLPRAATQLARSATLFTSILPQLVADGYALVVETKSLVRKRADLDWRMLAHPVLALLLERGTRAARDALHAHLVDARKKGPGGMPNAVGNALLGEIGASVADLGSLAGARRVFETRLHALFDADASVQTSVVATLHGILTALGSSSTLPVLLELSIVPWVLATKRMSHPEYAEAISDINRVFSIVRRMWSFTSLLFASRHDERDLLAMLDLKQSVGDLEATKMDCIVGGWVLDWGETGVAVRMDPVEEEGGGVCWVLEPGSSYGVVGRNMSGKSTFLRVLAGHLLPLPIRQSGDGEGGGAFTYFAERAHRVAYVPQTASLFSGTIRSNLQLAADAEIPDQDMVAALAIAGLDVEVSSPGRCVLDQEVEAGAGNLSGGQAQSVALARALLSPDKDVLLLDEAMSKMDEGKKERVVQSLVEHVRSSGQVLFAVTHDLRTVLPLFDHVVSVCTGLVSCSPQSPPSSSSSSQ